MPLESQNYFSTNSCSKGHLFRFTAIEIFFSFFHSQRTLKLSFKFCRCSSCHCCCFYLYFVLICEVNKTLNDWPTLNIWFLFYLLAKFFLFMFSILGTNTNSFAGFCACKCLKGFFRTHLFEVLECVDDYVTVRSGYWWKWKNDTHRTLCEQFKIILVNNTVTPILRVKSSSTDTLLLEYPYTLPQPHKCPRQESCIGGLDSLCDLGYQGPLCKACSADIINN